MAIMGYVGVNGVARKIKKIFVGRQGVAQLANDLFVGVNGVARSAFKRVRASVETLSYPALYMGAASNSAYAIFFGGRDNPTEGGTYTDLLTAFDKDLTRITDGNHNLYTSSVSRIYSGEIGDKCLFGNPSNSDRIWVFDKYLTKTSISMNSGSINVNKRNATAVSLRNHVFIAGGNGTESSSPYVMSIDESLTIVNYSENMTDPRYNMAGANINKRTAVFAGGTSISSELVRSLSVEAWDDYFVKHYFNDLSVRYWTPAVGSGSGTQGYTNNITGVSTGKFAMFGNIGVIDSYNGSYTQTVSNLPLALAGMGGNFFSGKAMFVGGSNWQSDDFSIIGGLTNEAYKLFKDIQEVSNSLTASIDSEDAQLSEVKVFPSSTIIGDYVLFAGGGVATNKKITTKAVDSVDAFK